MGGSRKKVFGAVLVLWLAACTETTPTESPFVVFVDLRPATAVAARSTRCVVFSVNYSADVVPKNTHTVSFSVDNQCGPVYMGFAYERSGHYAFTGCTVTNTNVDAGPAFRLEHGMTTINCAVSTVGCGKVQVKLLQDYF